MLTSSTGMRPTPRTSARARPLPPEERRAALIAATLPLVLEHGAAVTTRQIAEASGVAEGTIFRVFPDKTALIWATFEAACDPAPLLRELSGIDPGRPLRARLTEITTVLQRRLIGMFSLLSAMQIAGPPPVAHDSRRATNAAVSAAVTRLLEPDRDRLRQPPAEVARLLRLVVFSGSHPLITDGRALTPDEIVDLLLDGLLTDPKEAPAC